MIQAETIRLLSDLVRHPTRDRLDDHRHDINYAKADLKGFVASLLESATSIDNRIAVANKDLERSFGRVVGGQITKGEISLVVRVSSDPRAVGTYFVHLQSGKSYVGGGVRKPAVKSSRLFRQQMMTYTGRWREIVEGPVFRKFFPHGLTDGTLAIPKAGLVRNHDAMDSLNLRGFGACRSIPDQLLQSDVAIAEIVKSFAAARPLVDFINRATMR